MRLKLINQGQEKKLLIKVTFSDHIQGSYLTPHSLEFLQLEKCYV